MQITGLRRYFYRQTDRHVVSWEHSGELRRREARERERSENEEPKLTESTSRTYSNVVLLYCTAPIHSVLCTAPQFHT